MSFNLPEGAKFQFSTALAAAKPVSTITNASPAVATATAHGLATDDEFLFISGWEDATNAIYRANNLTADTFGIKGLDASNTNFFGVGSGIGTVQKITGWTDIPQVLTIGNSGGDARFTTVQLLSSRNAIQLPTGFNAASVTLTLAHDATLASYQTMLGISRNFTKVAFRVLMSGSVSYGYGHMSVSEVPQMQSGQVNQVNCAISFVGRPISY